MMSVRDILYHLICDLFRFETKTVFFLPDRQTLTIYYSNALRRAKQRLHPAVGRNSGHFSCMSTVG